MLTEAFDLICNGDKGYLNIDRTYKYGGIMLSADALEGVCLGGIDGFTYFEQFSLNNWLKALGLCDAIITIKVSKDCDGSINSTILSQHTDDVLSIVVKDYVVVEVKNSRGEVIYSLGDNEIGDWVVGWFGKVFDYYTNIISNAIEDYEEYDSCIWGVFYNEY